MSILVANKQQVLENIARFEEELDKSQELQRRLAYARAWYATYDDDGEWMFAPSKFCGYETMTAEEYVNDDPRDGRRTEKQLQNWFTIVPEDGDLFDELNEELTAFLAKYDKPPSTAVRINVEKEFLEGWYAGDELGKQREIADLLIAVARSLPADERQRVKAAI
ncbi:hypothetical protein [Qipengyuania seohaensis]|uniref:hypothetical protein n=1 Tax=Qipengyuania seohaensis TaxID=266951 RepID=UPI000C222F0D|nr:hypothetical protein [Qipengyuania seohaensis]